MRIFAAFLLLPALFMPSAAQAGVVEYVIDIAVQTVNYTGAPVEALTLGGRIPGPAIEATEGDTLRVTFNNRMDVETSIHWHGVLLPNDQDGVPWVTAPPIAPHGSFTYEFPVRHSGTYWYHAHSGLQEQRGVYGPLLFHKKGAETVSADAEYMVVWSDWTDENPERVLHNLKKDDEYYALKKDAVQSWLAVFRHGREAVASRLKNAWERMGPMDLSDVGYDAFLTNGEPVNRLSGIKGGQKVRLRMINAAASSYFYLQYAGGPMTIVAADGLDVRPLKQETIRHIIAETWDVIVTLPDDGKAYELRATAEDGSGHTSLILGAGAEIVHAPGRPRPDLFVMDHSAHGGHAGTDHSRHTQSGTPSGHETHAIEPQAGEDHSMMGHDTGHNGHKMDHGEAHQARKTPSSDPALSPAMREYELLRALKPTAYDPRRPVRDVPLTLNGDMESYTWTFNDKTLAESDKILIRKGETVRFTMKNETMMSHPIHLHGHFFRVLNGQGDYSPLKHTVNVPAFETVTIEFAADEEKDWFFHCHNLYHMATGMARIVSYEDDPGPYHHSMHNKDHGGQWHFFADAGVQSNMVFGNLRAEGTRNAFDIEYDWDYDDSRDVDAIYERRVNQFLDVYAGANLERDDGETDNRGVAGIHYVLPLLIDSDWRIDSEGHGRLELGSDLQLTDRAAFAWKANTDREYRLQLEYEITKRAVLTGGRDSDHGWGAGLTVRF